VLLCNKLIVYVIINGFYPIDFANINRHTHTNMNLFSLCVVL
jgi:hypothetical protein